MLELKRIAVVTLLVLAGPWIPDAQPQVRGVRGAWKVDSYTLKGGAEHHVEGLMMFSDSDWTVVYFVKADDGAPRRGVGAGGPYSLDGNELTLTRDYVVIGGDAIGARRFQLSDGDQRISTMNALGSKLVRRWREI